MCTDAAILIDNRLESFCTLLFIHPRVFHTGIVIDRIGDSDQVPIDVIRRLK